MAENTFASDTQPGQEWLWTWSGACFGYRRKNSLYTYDGVEVGRFLFKDIYGVDGGYLGEVRESGPSKALITNVYRKSSRIADGFFPSLSTSYPQPAGRAGRPLFMGHEDFPTPAAAKGRALPNIRGALDRPPTSTSLSADNLAALEGGTPLSPTPPGAGIVTAGSESPADVVKRRLELLAAIRARRTKA